MHSKVNDYIDAQYRRIKIRAHAIAVIRKHLEDINVRSAGIRDIDVFTAFSLYCASEPPESLNIEDFKELLIELSSLLTGHLGRAGGDRYYFLSELPMPATS